MEQSEWKDPSHNARTSKPAPWWRFETPASFAIALVGLIVLVSIVWFFTQPEEETNPDELPLVGAGPAIVKQRPENAGQASVPHQEKLVYNRLAPSQADDRIEKLLPEPERPLDLKPEAGFPSEDTPDNELPAFLTPEESEAIPQKSQDEAFETFGKTEDTHEGPLVKTPIGNVEEEVRQAPTTTVKNETPAPQVMRLLEAENTPSPTKTSKKPAAEKKVPAGKPTSKGDAQKGAVNVAVATQTRPVTTDRVGGYRVQVASLPTPDLAKKEWSRLEKVHGAPLKGQHPHYVRVDLGAKKGVFYRVQVGSFTERQEAQTLCKTLREQNPKAACLVVPR